MLKTAGLFSPIKHSMQFLIRLDCVNLAFCFRFLCVLVVSKATKINFIYLTYHVPCKTPAP